MRFMKGKKGISGWLIRHPLLAILGVVFCAFMIAVVLAMVTSTSHTAIESSTPWKKRPKHPTIAGAAVHMPAIISPAPAMISEDPVSKWNLLLFQGIMVLVGAALSLYLVHLITNFF